MRLTVGGEPTFVSVDDMDGEEWNSAADGPAKRTLAAELIGRLRARFAPGGLLHFGQGKWYPGESLPRWAYALYWRRDGRPLWRDASLLTLDGGDRPALVDDAGRFVTALAATLGIDPDHALPTYEDPLPFIAREQSLPENVDPSDSKLEDPKERARLARVFERGLGNPVGWTLPIQRWNARDGHARWISERWSARRGRLFLVPGDSPLGFRLPLGSLPWVPPERYPYYMPADPFEERPALPDPEVRPRQRVASVAGPAGGQEKRQQIVEQRLPTEIGGAVRTAISIEPRDGHLCVFIPPLERVDDYVDLVGAIEDTAAAVDLPVRLEGYMPPPDPRIGVIKVTPDPGVIEVNIHPARSWQELVEITTGLYEEARQSRLGTEKFMLDGRHTGTGGGNHIVVGGPTPADSPFLRRPDLLRSLITYWQNHPALSYLFSGLFIGPTSQAPRIDEARNDQLYELEIAFRQIPDPDGTPVPPWLVDRIFRNLLIDVTGNTHRAEICIDKLYSPDGPDRPAGPGRVPRLRDAAARPDEPRPAPSAARADRLVLARALQAAAGALAAPPCTTASCCRTYVWKDFLDVIADLRRAGIAIESEWFAPHFEFRFPLYGAVEHAGAIVELRQALEPWHVMGEEGAIGGTVRYVDSSVERLQVRMQWHDGGAARACLQSSASAAAIDRHFRRVRRRRPLPCLAAAAVPASDDSGRQPADLRSVRHLVQPVAGRLHLSRRAPRRPQLRNLPGQCLRGGEPALRPLLPVRPHGRRLPASAAAGQPGVSDDTRPEVEPLE